MSTNRKRLRKMSRRVRFNYWVQDNPVLAPYLRRIGK